MSLAPYVRILGRGPGRARPLTHEESAEAMEIILSGAAAPEALGALLMLMRFQGETPEEIAGFTEALRGKLAPGWARLKPAVDWPSYAAGRSRGAPLFLLSARLLVQAGHPVLLHGYNSHQGTGSAVRPALEACGIPSAETPDQAAKALQTAGIAYVPIEAMLPKALDLLKLRNVLGLRSCLNTVVRMLNPGGAGVMLQGVFHPGYRDLQSEAAALMGHQTLSVIKGGGGEFERHPAKPCSVYGLTSGQMRSEQALPLMQLHRRLAETDQPMPDLAALWAGTLEDSFAEAIVTGTAGVALWTLGAAETLQEADAMAAELWLKRLPVPA